MKYIGYPDEEWAPICIKGEPTKYSISTYGNVRNNETGKLISQFVHNNGYYGFTLSHKGKLHSFKTATLVAKTFIENNDPTKTQVNHKTPGKESKKDNSIYNLEWVTPAENQMLSYLSGVPRVILNEEIVNDICRRLENDEPISKIAIRYDVTPAAIYKILDGDTYAYISCKYDFSKRGKHKSGTKASISAETIHKICQLYLEGAKVTDIAEEVSIPENTVFGVVSNKYKAYSDIVTQYDFSGRKKPKNKKSIDDSIVHEICKYIEDGYGIPEIASKCNVSTGAVTKIKRKERRTDISSLYNF